MTATLFQDTHTQVRHVARMFVIRAKRQKWTRERADVMALDFFLGAASLAEIQGNSDLFNRLQTLAVVIATKGMDLVEDLSKS